MDKGARALAMLMLVSLALGALVLVLHPSYRKAAVAQARGRPEESPIWRSNAAYYPDVGLPARGGSADER